MTDIFIDNAHVPVRGVGCCHMASEDFAALEQMVLKLGADPEWIDRQGKKPVVLINRSLRKRARDLGAKVITRKEMATLSK